TRWRISSIAGRPSALNAGSPVLNLRCWRWLLPTSDASAPMRVAPSSGNLANGAPVMVPVSAEIAMTCSLPVSGSSLAGRLRGGQDGGHVSPEGGGAVIGEDQG